MRIAIVGIGCRYPDAAGPDQLWENVVAGRRAFRRIPDERLNMDDYWSPDPAAPDRIYARTAAVLKNYTFDRVRFRTAGSTYRSTDMTHWLALDVAAQALADAGFPDGAGLPAERTAVIIGNTLTGEFSRANVLRLRWPYVRRVVAAALRDNTDWADSELTGFLEKLETDYKLPFPVPDEDSLAGALANTIAGRICNHFDLGGGGYTIDGACSSSLLSVATACDRLTDGDIDLALAGGVDLSIDAFELVGFAKTGALARREMRVYDRGSNGFWPGEGCGMVVLMREADAIAQGRRVYATVAGWGISSDGHGGITRPEADGYRRALDRAYGRAGYGIETVSFFEGHGTGTAVGDATELRALSEARHAAGANERAAIGTIKAMIGHTKAAAGVAGLIKATLAVHHGTIPPTVGCVDPDPQLTGDDAALRAPRAAEDWPDGMPRRAGVTAMGFGGINTHVAVESAGPADNSSQERHQVLARGLQDAELLLFEAPDPVRLRAEAARLRAGVARLAYAELGDLAAVQRASLTGAHFRAAVVVRSPEDAVTKLDALVTALDEGRTDAVEPAAGWFVGAAGATSGRLGLLFPGQGSGRGTTGGALRRRFAEADEIYRRADLPTGRDTVATEVAQPRIVAGSLAGLRVLTGLGLTARVALGHSLGELSALHWAGALDEAALIRVAAHRGAVMGRVSTPGTMAALTAGPDAARALIGGEPVVVAGLNGPRQAVIAGPVDAVERVCAAAGRAGIRHNRLAVSHAFHSSLMTPAAEAFGAWLTGQSFAAPSKRVISTVTGSPLDADVDLPALLGAQITEPVRFADAVVVAAAEVDLFIEVGPGRVLSGMVSELCAVPVVALDTDDESSNGLLGVLAAAYVRGAPPPPPEFFIDRLIRSLDLAAPVSFLANPCEAAPQPVLSDTATPPGKAVAESASGHPVPADGRDALSVLRALVADRAELPEEVLADDSRLLDDLHFSSITVGQLVNRAALELGLDPAAAPANFATATVRELATALEELAGTGPAPAGIDGVAPWVRPFVVDLIEEPCAVTRGSEPDGRWAVHAPPADRSAEPLRTALEQGGVGDGVLVIVPARPSHDDLERALVGVQAAVRQRGGARLVLVQAPGAAAGAVARTARLEYPQLRTTVLTIDPDDDAPALVVADVAATIGYAETVHHGGVRRTPVARVLPVDDEPAGDLPLSSDDVLLVTGGGKGITAESALALTVGTGATLVLLGRSDPAADAELAANLARVEEAGVPARYVQVDVTDRAAVRAAVALAESALGPVTAVLHGAGRNEPTPLTALDGAALRNTLAPKVDGLRNVLAAVDGGRLRLLVTFGSIIGRAGLPGEAHYALANEQLAELTRSVGADWPDCRVLCLEWSVWSGVGMGERLSVVESLLRAGVTPISADDGVAMLRRLVSWPGVPPVVVVSGRTGGADTVRYHRPELPLLRFLERPLVHYHDVELVSEVRLTPTTDRYLDDHRLDGERVFPAVLGVEAMTQVATALIGAPDVPRMERVEFARPIVVGDDGTDIRIAALRTAPGVVDVVIRCAESGFRVDHFRATLRFETDPADPADPAVLPAEASGSRPTLVPDRDLYDGVFFPDGRFRRVTGYRRIAARCAEAVVTAADRADWFSAFLPGQLLLGDPGARDAFLHGIQVCVPDAMLIPAGVDEIVPAGPKLGIAGPVVVTARERSHDGAEYVYDLSVRDSAGVVVERWSGLRLRALRRPAPVVRPAPDLLGPYLQRRLETRLGVEVAVMVSAREGPRRRGETAGLLAAALDRPVEVRYRPDGRPLVDGSHVSAAYTSGVGLAVAATMPVTCDAEPVVARSADDWRGLLGEHAGLADRIAVETGEPWDTAATRVWCAIECRQKAGQFTGPLTVRPGAGDGWVSLAAGAARVETYATMPAGATGPLVLAVLAEKG